jgi:hypothetical protein
MPVKLNLVSVSFALLAFFFQSRKFTLKIASLGLHQFVSGQDIVCTTTLTNSCSSLKTRITMAALKHRGCTVVEPMIYTEYPISLKYFLDFSFSLLWLYKCCLLFSAFSRKGLRLCLIFESCSYHLEYDWPPNPSSLGL